MRALTHAAPTAPAAAPAVSAVQCKLRVGAPDDGFEREADRIADAVMGASRSDAISVRPTPVGVQRSCAACEKEDDVVQRKCSSCEAEDELAQRKAGAPGAAPAARTQQHIAQLRGEGGAPLPAPTRSFMQQRFGFDFSHVRVHSGSVAQQAASGLGARAFTVGRDIAFASGEYAPDSARGQRLLAHELTHVLQQRHGAGQMIQRECAHDKGPQVNPVLYLGKYDASVPALKAKMTAYFAGRPADSNGVIALTAKKERDPLFQKYFPLPAGTKYDAKTQTAIQVFQTEQNLPMAAASYGVVERCTWEALDKLPGPQPEAKPEVKQPTAVKTDAVAQPPPPPPKKKEAVDLRTPAQLLIEGLTAGVKGIEASGGTVGQAKAYVNQHMIGGVGGGGGLGTKAPEPQKAKEGKMCHKVISAYYAGMNPGTIVNDEEVGALNDQRILKLLLKAGVTLTNEQFADLPEDLAALLTRRPDILDAPKLEVFEIKPFPQVALAEAEALWYINILKRFARRAGVEGMELLKRGSPSNAGTHGFAPGDDGVCIWACPLPGAIVYQVVRPPENPRARAEQLEYQARGISDLSIGVEGVIAISSAVVAAAIVAASTFPALLAALAELAAGAGAGATTAGAGAGAGALIPAVVP